MKLSRPVVAAVASTALIGAIALPAQAAATHPATTQAAVTHTAGPSASITTRSHPGPKPFRDAVVRAAEGGLGAAGPTASTSTTASTSRPRPAGVRPIGSNVSTDLPTRVVLGGPALYTPYTVTVPTASFTRPAVQIGLVNTRGQLVWQTFTAGTRGQTTFSGSVAVPIATVGEPGAGRWIVVYGEADSQSDNLPTAQLGTTIKLRTLLARHLTRRGPDIRVFGALKQYDFSLVYSPRQTVPVAVQRWSTRGWITVRTVRTDVNGHIDTTVRIPWKVGIRLSTPDSSAYFGAVTASASV